MSHNTETILAERGSRYGDFTGHARITQEIKTAMKHSTKWKTLKDDQREALEMVAHKIGRILNGDPDYLDSWDDIEGYVRLVANRLRKDQHVATQKVVTGGIAPLDGARILSRALDADGYIPSLQHPHNEP